MSNARSRRVVIAGRVTLAVFGFVLSLAASEAALRHLGCRQLPGSSRQSAPFLAENRYWGVWHYPNHVVDHEESCFRARYRTNSLGMRGPEVRPGTAKIALLGDSFVEGFGNDDDATQTKHARTWLEVVVDGRTSDSMRWADFAIRSIDGLSATDLTKVPAAREGDSDVRRVTMTVHGDLLVHGHKVEKEDAVEVAFRYAPGASAEAKPGRIEMKSKHPMRVVLKEHDVSPRDTQGKIAAWTTNLIAKVAETADVTVDLAATPAM